LDSKAIAIENEEDIVIKATVGGNRWVAEVGSIRLESNDDTFTEGCVALLADVPARFDDLKVICSTGELDRLNKACLAWKSAEEAASQRQPSLKLWRRMLSRSRQF
jgi:hypothetical protein